MSGRNRIVYPGLINTHHHFYQTLTRNYPAVQSMELFPWLKALYQLWRGLDDKMIYNSSQLALASMAMYGCTTAHDHHYVFPKESNNFIDMQIKAASDLGVRIHASRGSMSRGVSDGGLPPDELVQTKEAILKDSERLIKAYHDSSEGSMSQIVLAPCSPFSVTSDLMRDSAHLARQYGVKLHTHLCETIDEEEYCIKTYGMRPLEYMESLGWLGSDVWFAHGIHFSFVVLDILATSRTGVAHCPTSNMKLSSGIAKINEMLEKGVPVGLAVDGSASNDGSNLLAEIRVGYLLHRLRNSRTAPTGDQILRIATRGSADILGRRDLGSIELGKQADVFLININHIDYAGTLDDPASIPAVVGITQPVEMTIVKGEVVYEKGEFKNLDMEKLIYETNKQSDILRTFK